MVSVVGIFQTMPDAADAVTRLYAIPIPAENINLLSPGPAEQEKAELDKVPLSETEQPGMGAGLGGVVGAAIGLAGGISGGTAVASLLVPGVGPVIAIGLAAAGVLGAAGTVVGAKMGNALESASTYGLPEDELFFYQDALRNGHTVLLTFASNESEAKQVRSVLQDAGAESVDAAREQWWIGLRDSERVHYEQPGEHHEGRESIYRSGFEAALRPGMRGKSYEEAKDTLRRMHPDLCDDALFMHGYRRGQEFEQGSREEGQRRRVA
ncbi:MAG TPA: hypothetical protein VKT29_09540 [Terriglobales bacterium]|nr:hypothetical protein [Terriglobales bacterium]